MEETQENQDVKACTKPIGKLYANATRAPAEIRKSRAKSLVTDIVLGLQQRIARYEKELINIQMKKDQLLDLSPSNSFTTSFEVDTEKLVDNYVTMCVEEERLQITYNILKKEYLLLTGSEYMEVNVNI